jgi:micrococcal nuclease
MYTYNAKLSRIIDGDTIVAMVDLGFSTWKKVTIRMHGINTPEIRTKDLDEKVKGFAAKDRLAELIELENEGVFTLQSHGVGKFGRCLGDVFVGGININQQLINEGHAVEYFGGVR